MTSSCPTPALGPAAMLVAALVSAASRLPWQKPPPPAAPPGPNYIVLPITFETLLAILVCWITPIAVYTFMTAHTISEEGKRAAVTGKGDTVHMDIERRKQAEAADPVQKKENDRKLQLLMWVYRRMNGGSHASWARRSRLGRDCVLCRVVWHGSAARSRRRAGSRTAGLWARAT